MHKLNYSWEKMEHSDPEQRFRVRGFAFKTHQLHHSPDSWPGTGELVSTGSPQWQDNQYLSPMVMVRSKWNRMYKVLKIMPGTQKVLNKCHLLLFP